MAVPVVRNRFTGAGPGRHGTVQAGSGVTWKSCIVPRFSWARVWQWNTKVPVKFRSG